MEWTTQITCERTSPSSTPSWRLEKEYARESSTWMCEVMNVAGVRAPGGKLQTAFFTTTARSPCVSLKKPQGLCQAKITLGLTGPQIQTSAARWRARKPAPITGLEDAHEKPIDWRYIARILTTLNCISRFNVKNASRHKSFLLCSFKKLFVRKFRIHTDSFFEPNSLWKGFSWNRIGVIRRNFRVTSKECKAGLYCTLVRPKLEYANAPYYKHLEKDGCQLDMVQRSAARLCCNNYSREPGSVTSILKDLGWPTLEARRKLAD